MWNAYGIPAPLLNDLAHATLSNTREFERQPGGTRKGRTMLRADEITEQFLPMFPAARPPPPDVAEFDSLTWRRCSRRDRKLGPERQASRSAMTVNEWRRRHGMAPVAWGEVWWAPVNKSAVSGAESRPEGDTTPTGGGQVDETNAAEVMAALEVGRWEMRHGPLRLNGHAREGAR